MGEKDKLIKLIQAEDYEDMLKFCHEKKMLIDVKAQDVKLEFVFDQDARWHYPAREKVLKKCIELLIAEVMEND